LDTPKVPSRKDFGRFTLNPVVHVIAANKDIYVSRDLSLLTHPKPGGFPQISFSFVLTGTWQRGFS
jgi:hypothetical protein